MSSTSAQHRALQQLSTACATALDQASAGNSKEDAANVALQQARDVLPMLEIKLISSSALDALLTVVTKMVQSSSGDPALRDQVRECIKPVRQELAQRHDVQKSERTRLAQPSSPTQATALHKGSTIVPGYDAEKPDRPSIATHAPVTDTLSDHGAAGPSGISYVGAATASAGTVYNMIALALNKGLSEAAKSDPWQQQVAGIRQNMAELGDLAFCVEFNPRLDAQLTSSCIAECRAAISTLQHTAESIQRRGELSDRLHAIQDGLLHADAKGARAKYDAMVALTTDADATFSTGSDAFAELSVEDKAVLDACHVCCAGMAALAAAAKHQPTMFDQLGELGRQSLIKLGESGILDPTHGSETTCQKILAQIDARTHGASEGGVDNVLEGLANGDPDFVRLVFGREAYWDPIARTILVAAHASESDPTASDAAVALFNISVAKRDFADAVRRQLWKHMPAQMRADANFDSIVLDPQTIRAIVSTLGPKAAKKTDLLIANAILLETAFHHKDPLLATDGARADALARLAVAGIKSSSVDEVSQHVRQGFKSYASLNASILVLTEFHHDISGRKDLGEALRMAATSEIHGKADEALSRVARAIDKDVDTHAPGACKRAIVAKLTEPLGETKKALQDNAFIVQGRIKLHQKTMGALAALREDIHAREATLMDKRFDPVRDQTDDLEGNQLVLRFCELHDSLRHVKDPALERSVIQEMRSIQRKLASFSTTEGRRTSTGRMAHVISDVKDPKKLLAHRHKSELIVLQITEQRQVNALRTTAAHLQENLAENQRELVALLGDKAKAIETTFSTSMLDLASRKEDSKEAHALQVFSKAGGGKHTEAEINNARAILVSALTSDFRVDMEKHQGAVVALAEQFVDALYKYGVDRSITLWAKSIDSHFDSALTLIQEKVRDPSQNIAGGRLSDSERQKREENVRRIFENLDDRNAYDIGLGASVGVKQKIPLDPSGATTGTVQFKLMRDNSLKIQRDDSNAATPYKVVIKQQTKAGISLSVAALMKVAQGTVSAGEGVIGGLVLSFKTQEECEKFVTQLVTDSLPTDHALDHVEVIQNVKGMWHQRRIGVTFGVPMPGEGLMKHLQRDEAHAAHEKKHSDPFLSAEKLEKKGIGLLPKIEATYTYTSDWELSKNAFGETMKRSSEHVATVAISGPMWKGVKGAAERLCTDLSDTTKLAMASGISVNLREKQQYSFGREGYVTSSTKIERSVRIMDGSHAPVAVSMLLPESPGGHALSESKIDALKALGAKATAGDEVVVTYQLTPDAALSVNQLLATGHTADRAKALRILADEEHSYTLASLSIIHTASSEQTHKTHLTAGAGMANITFETSHRGGKAHEVGTVVF